MKGRYCKKREICRRDKIIIRISFFFLLLFFGLWGRLPSLPRDFTVYNYTVTLPVLRDFHCKGCRIRTRESGVLPMSHHISEWATTSPNEPPHLRRATTSPRLEFLSICCWFLPEFSSKCWWKLMKHYCCELTEKSVSETNKWFHDVKVFWSMWRDFAVDFVMVRILSRLVLVAQQTLWGQ